MVALDRDTLKKGLGNLGRVPSMKRHAFLSLSLSEQGLSDIDALGDYEHLQDINLEGNALTSLGALGAHTHLVRLNVAGNSLTSLLDFQAPRALQSLDCSRNRVPALQNLESNKYLLELNLEDNLVASLESINVLRFLRSLNVSGNKISDLSPLDNPHLQNLELRGNNVSDLSTLKPHAMLRFLDLSDNAVSSLSSVQRHPLLTALRLPNNQVATLDEVRKLVGLKELRELDLRGNPIQDIADYRMHVLYILPNLVSLDGDALGDEEIVGATNFHGVDNANKLAVYHQYLPKGDATVPADVPPNGARAPPYLDVDSPELAQSIIKDQLPLDRFWKRVGEHGYVTKWESFIGKLKHNPQETLDLNDVGGGEVGFWVVSQALRDNPSTKHVKMDGFWSPNAYTSQISALYGARYIIEAMIGASIVSASFSRCFLSRDAGPMVARLLRNAKQLVSLNLSHNFLGVPKTKFTQEGGVVVVNECPALEVICEALRDSNLTELNISYNRITSGGAVVLAQCLKDGNGRAPLPLKSLNLSGNPVSNGSSRVGTSDPRLGTAGIGGVLIAEALRTNENLEELVWTAGDSPVSTGTLVSLCRTLAKFNDSITSVDISGQSCGDEAGIEMAKALNRDLRHRTSSSVLKKLTMRGCGVGSAGIAALAASVANCATLTELDLSHNNSDDDALAALFGAVQSCEKLTSARFSGMRLGSKSGRALGELLASGRELKVLEVGGGGAQEDGAEGEDAAASFAMDDSTTIKGLSTLSVNGLDGAGAVAAAQGAGMSELGLGSHVWGSKGWDALVAMLADGNAVEKLLLNGSVLAFEGASSAVSNLIGGASKAIKDISLDGVQLGSIGGVAQGLASNSALEVLSLTNCNLGEDSDTDGSLDTLVSSLGAPIGLKVLHLRSNSLSGDFLLSLANGLRQNSSLQELYLAGNVVEYTEPLCAVFGELICASSTLRKLEMFDVFVGEEVTTIEARTRPGTGQAKREKDPIVDLSIDEESCPATIGEGHVFLDGSAECCMCGRELLEVNLDIRTAPSTRPGTASHNRAGQEVTTAALPHRAVQRRKNLLVSHVATALGKVSAALEWLDVGAGLKSGLSESNRRSICNAIMGNQNCRLGWLLCQGTVVVGEPSSSLDNEWNALSAALATNRLAGQGL